MMNHRVADHRVGHRRGKTLQRLAIGLLQLNPLSHLGDLDPASRQVQHLAAGIDRKHSHTIDPLAQFDRNQRRSRAKIDHLATHVATRHQIVDKLSIDRFMVHLVIHHGRFERIHHFGFERSCR